MTKKDYIKIAQVLKIHYQDTNDYKTLIQGICNMLKEDNELFDLERFYKAVID